LKELRDYVEQNGYGFGERAFYWMWKLLVDDMPKRFSFLEIGVYKGQHLALIKLLAKMSKRTVQVHGITPLDSTDGYPEYDYLKDIHDLHRAFKLPLPIIFKGLSTDPTILEEIYPKYDIIYIDGGHSYDVVKYDLETYSPRATKYVVTDDSANSLNLPEGMFKGHQSVTKAVDEWLPCSNFVEKFNVVHNRIFKVKSF